jgi:hypothetical protein
MTGMPVAGRQPDAHPPRTVARRPGMVWGALLLPARLSRSARAQS